MTKVSLLNLQNGDKKDANIIVFVTNFHEKRNKHRYRDENVYENDKSVVMFINILIHEKEHVPLLK